MSATAATPTPAPRADFPTWLPPMLVKELRQGLRTRGFVGAFVVFQLLMALMMIGTVTSAALGNAGARAATAATVNAFFWTMLGVQLLAVTPARALGSLQSETDSRTLDLLLLTRLSAWRIVVGKWASLLAQAVLLLVAMLPYGIVRYFGGSVDLVDDAVVCAALLGGCAVVTAAGLWASGLPKIIRIAVPVVAIFFGQVWQQMFRTTSGLFAGGAWELWCLNGALVMVFFLVTAVRRIAPPAESHVLLARGLPLLALAPVPLWRRGARAGRRRGSACLPRDFSRWCARSSWRACDSRWRRTGGRGRGAGCSDAASAGSRCPAGRARCCMRSWRRRW